MGHGKASAMVALGALALAAQAFAAPAFFPVRLAAAVMLELPGDWTVVEGGPRDRPETRVRSLARSGGDVDATSQRRFAADDYDDAGRVAARIEVRYDPGRSVSQAEVEDATDYEISRVDKAMRAAVEKSATRLGVSVLEWKGTERRDLHGTTGFVSEYRRSPWRDNGVFVVKMLRVLDGPQSFTVTLSYREDEGARLRPLCERILASVRRTPAGSPS